MHCLLFGGLGCQAKAMMNEDERDQKSKMGEWRQGGWLGGFCRGWMRT